MTNITHNLNTTKPCVQCGVVFSKPIGGNNGTWKRRKFCNSKCSRKYLLARPGNGFCLQCKGQLRLVKQSKYCSNVCKRESVKGLKRSPETIKKMRLASLQQKNRPRGEKASGWKGGTTKLTQQIFNSPELKAWRKGVYEREDFTCQACGVQGGKLNCDHVVPLCEILHMENIKQFSDIRETSLLWDTYNGRTLCIPCHKKTPTYGVNAKWIMRTLRHMSEAVTN